MRIMLVNPNTHFSKSGGIGQPIGLLSVATSLSDVGHEVKLLDANALNLSFWTIFGKIFAFKPNVVGISVNTLTVDYALKLASYIKRSLPTVKIVLGGVHATIFAEQLIELDCVDSIVKGEGEFAIHLAIEQNGIFKEPIKDLDEISSPDWTFLDLDVYKNYLADGRFAMLMTSRGCPFNCTFCSAHLMCGKKVRYRGQESIEQEVESLATMGAKTILLEDDTFTLNSVHTLFVCEVLKNNGFKWWCNTRLDTIDYNTLLDMKESGCVGCCVGIESGDDAVLNKMNKGLTTEQISKGVKLIHQTGLKVYGYFMIGNVGDTEETLRETVDFSKKLPLDYAQFSVATPFPATELWNYAVKAGIIKTPVKNWSMFDWECEPPNVSNVSVERRRWWYRKAIKEFYFRPKFIFKHLTFKDAKTAWRMLR